MRNSPMKSSSIQTPSHKPLPSPLTTSHAHTMENDDEDDHFTTDNDVLLVDVTEENAAEIL